MHWQHLVNLKKQNFMYCQDLENNNNMHWQELVVCSDCFYMCSKHALARSSKPAERQQYALARSSKPVENNNNLHWQESEVCSHCF